VVLSLVPVPSCVGCWLLTVEATEKGSLFFDIHKIGQQATTGLYRSLRRIGT